QGLRHESRRRGGLHHRNQDHGRGGVASADTEVSSPSALRRFINATLSTGPGAASVAWARRARGGEMGALPDVGGLVVLMVLFSLSHDKFLTERNIANLFTQAAPLVMLGMALVFVLLLGEIDLSAGVTFGVSMAVFVKYTQPD